MADKTITTWRYALSREHLDGDDAFFIREIYEDTDGGLSWSENPIAPTGSSWWEIADDLTRMSGACSRTVLDLTLTPPALVHPREIRRR